MNCKLFLQATSMETNTTTRRMDFTTTESEEHSARSLLRHMQLWSQSQTIVTFQVSQYTILFCTSSSFLLSEWPWQQPKKLICLILVQIWTNKSISCLCYMSFFLPLLHRIYFMTNENEENLAARIYGIKPNFTTQHQTRLIFYVYLFLYLCY